MQDQNYQMLTLRKEYQPISRALMIVTSIRSTNSWTYYTQGQYDSAEGFKKFNEEMEKYEKDSGVDKPERLFYLALPPSVFVTVASHIKENAYTKTGEVRLIVEKPFGNDLESSRKLQKSLAPLFTKKNCIELTTT